MSTPSAEPDHSAPTRRTLRRLSVELVLIVLAKIALLTLIWWVAIAPHPRPDSSPAAISKLLGPSSSPPQEANP
ncbi:MAG: cytochrome oxidase putative small subunit CydP [Rhodanobacter sp.]